MAQQFEVGIKIERISSPTMLEQCADLFLHTFNSAPWNDKWTRETAITLFTCYYHTPDFMGWAAVLGDKIVGCAMGNTEPHYSGKIFYLREMFVAASLQKMGIGRRLMASMKNDLKSVDTNTIILFTQKAISRYYTKFGFSEIKEMEMMRYPTN